MNSTLMKTTFGMLALGLMTTGAQANWERDGYDHHEAYLQQTLAYSQQIDARQDWQARRIQSAMRAGYLTRFEFRELMQEQHQIRAMEHHFRSDGRIDAREFQRLDRALDSAARTIRTEKHDRRSHPAYDRYSRFD